MKWVEMKWVEESETGGNDKNMPNNDQRNNIYHNG